MGTKNRIWDRKKLTMLVSGLVVILLIIVLVITIPFGSKEVNTLTEPSDESTVTTDSAKTDPKDISDNQTAERTKEPTAAEQSGQEIESSTEMMTEEQTEATTEESQTEPPTQPTESESGTENQTRPTQSSHSGGDSENQTQTTQPSQETEPPTEETQIASGDITCDEFAIFSGQFVEDGRDELVENVAAILITNQSDRFLNFAVLSYDIDGETGLFVVTGLPAGESAWVMEITELNVNHDAVFTYLDCMSSFRDSVISHSDEVTITSDGNMLIATNNTDKTLASVFVYYKTRHTDGNFFGGITYAVEFGTLEPGASAEKLAGHYEEGTTEIIRIGWQPVTE